MFGLPQQYHDSSHMDEPQEVPGCLLVPGRHTPVLLDPVDEPFGKVAFLVKNLIIFSLEDPILLRRNHGIRTGGHDRLDEIISVISLVRDHRIGIMTFNQGLALIDVGLLSPRQDELDGVPQTVDGDMQLGSEPAPRASQGLVGTPFFTAPAACWWARITVLSRISHSKSGSFITSKTRAQTPLADQRSNRFHTEFHLPKRSGMSRQGAPVLPIQSTASTKRRLSLAVTPGSPARPGRKSSIRSQCSSAIAWRCMGRARRGRNHSGDYLSYENHPDIVHTA